MMKTGLDPFMIGIALECPHDWKPGVQTAGSIAENGSTTVSYFEDELCIKCGITKFAWGQIQAALQ